MLTYFKKVFFLLIFISCVGWSFLTSAGLANTRNDYKNVEIFTDVLTLIRDSYVDEVDIDQLTHGAIRGMLETLDPHSSFLTPEMYREMQEETRGEFSGLGIEIAVKDGELIVVSPIEDTPAYFAGVKAGDKIIKINGKLTRDLDIFTATRMMRGPVGEKIELTVKRAHVDLPLDFTIVRKMIQIQSVKSKLLNDHYGYVRISQFQDRTGSDLKKQLQKLREKSALLRGLILDLRNNPGGLLEQAVAVSDLFLDAGLIVYTEGRGAESQAKFTAQVDGTEPAYPMIVLIDGGSASAAEIVAGALQDHDRAIILGQQSFGKGSVQTVVPLGNDYGLRLTTARYYTPAGRSIQALGIHPDIVVSPRVIVTEQATAAEHPLRERDLEHHFQPAAGSNEAHKQSTPAAAVENGDNQLQRALDLLKGLDILQRQQHS